MDRKKCRRLRWVIALALVGVVGFLLGILLMRLIMAHWKGEDISNSIRERIQEEIKAENIRNNLRETTLKPHLAGTPADFETAEALRSLWLRQGLDSAKLVSYDVLLQYPPEEKDKRNRVQIVKDGVPVYESSYKLQTFGEEVLEQDDITPPFHAYSGNGDVTGEPIYANYGLEEDFGYLTNEGINVSGKIAICRWGLLLSTVAKNAERLGVAAVIMFPDPAEVWRPGTGETYPHGPHLPRNATVMGSLFQDTGDPLTPGYPSTDGAFRVPRSSTNLPNIPVHPISYGDAEKIIGQMTGNKVPDSWRGGLETTYHIGPGFEDESRKIRVFVNSTMKRATTYNAIGFIRGAVEPDRYVIIGNHRDAWVLGAVDPTGGTAVLMEISRVFGMLKQEGWRPRRSIMFASWGAEEYSLIGSVEWMEQYRTILTKRAVAYLNLDVAVAGGHVVMPSYSALLKNVAIQTFKQVKDPYPTETVKTLYDSMQEKFGENPEDLFQVVTGGTDFEAFIYGIGTSVFSAYYASNWEDQYTFYSLYHTAYETFRLVDEYIDKGFLRHRAMGQLFAEMLRNIADSTLINGDVASYGILVHAVGEKFRDKYMDQILNNTVRNISIVHLSNAIDAFQDAAESYQYTTLPSVDHDNPLVVRAINDQMMYLEQSFIARDNITPNPVYRHILFASPGLFDIGYMTFPGIMVAMDGIDSDPDQEARWAEVERQLAIVTHAVQSATSALHDFISW